MNKPKPITIGIHNGAKTHFHSQSTVCVILKMKNTNVIKNNIFFFFYCGKCPIISIVSAKSLDIPINDC